MIFVKLSECPVGCAIKLLAIDLPEANVSRLRELGLGVGGRVRVTHRAAFGGRVIAIDASRIALDGATVRRISVEAAA